MKKSYDQICILERARGLSAHNEIKMSRKKAEIPQKEISVKDHKLC